MDIQYNNELTPEVLAKMGKSPLVLEQLAEIAEFNDDARELIAGQQEYCCQHPGNEVRVVL
ncbi:hypothetical protein [Rouxiella sp. WC2420]|uniref:Uncharacterized protein n=1 Tax=Rouxiella sp. WC2420 TaxID=3234145 RepID=A0AB39VUH9_9GAMM